jgi:hypothetical protein
MSGLKRTPPQKPLNEEEPPFDYEENEVPQGEYDVDVQEPEVVEPLRRPSGNTSRPNKPTQAIATRKSTSIATNDLFETDYDAASEALDEAMVRLRSNAHEGEILRFKWNGQYYIRLLPILKGRPPIHAFGQHWNLMPDHDGEMNVLNCPKITFGQNCDICAAIGREVDEGRATFRDFSGMGGASAQAKAMFLAIIIDIQPTTPDADVSAMKLPAIRIVEANYTISKWLKDRWYDVDVDRSELYDPKEGRIIRVSRLEVKKRVSYEMQMMKPYPIPAEFLDPAIWPKVNAYLPSEDITVIRKKLMANVYSLPDWLANYLQTIPVKGAAIRKQHQSEEEDPYA